MVAISRGTFISSCTSCRAKLLSTESFGPLAPLPLIESRGARIKRVMNVNWRGSSSKPYQRKAERAGRITKFTSTYRSSPTLHIMRMLASQEELFHSGKGRGAARLKESGRFRKVKIEADHSNAKSYEMDPFSSLSKFLSDANVP